MGPCAISTTAGPSAPTQEGGCEIDFSVDFTFRNAVFEAIAGQYFDRAFRKMVEAFERRADDLYGREAAPGNA